MTGLKTIFRVRLRLATFSEEGVTWQQLVVDRPSAEEASDLIKWAHRLDRDNNIVRPYPQECKVDRRKIPDDGLGSIPLLQVCASLEAHFTLRRASAP